MVRGSRNHIRVISMLSRFFKLREHNTTVSREILAGVTTFAAMAYALTVNPSILAAAGMDKAALVTITAISAATATILMALIANYPLAMAPGMGINAMFTYAICQEMHTPWPDALGMVFVNGIIFFVLSVTNVRRRIVDAIPYSMKIAITCGIGFFIAFLGLQKGGIVVRNPDTILAVGNFASGPVALCLGGLALTTLLVARRAPGAIIIGVIATTVAGAFVPVVGGAFVPAGGGASAMQFDSTESGSGSARVSRAASGVSPDAWGARWERGHPAGMVTGASSYHVGASLATPCLRGSFPIAGAGVASDAPTCRLPAREGLGGTPKPARETRALPGNHVDAPGISNGPGARSPMVTHLDLAGARWLPASPEPHFLKLTFHFLTSWRAFAGALPVILTLLMISMFDSIGTLIGVSKRAGLLDAHGNLPRIQRAFYADSIAATLSALFGTSTVVSYAESASGVEVGGRTGLTGVTVAVLLLLALFLTPVILCIPDVAVAPALIVVGIFMMQSALEIDMRDFTNAAPAVLTIMTIPLTFSISNGIGIGILAFVIISLFTGKARSISLAGYVIAAMFFLKFFHLFPFSGST